MFKGYNLHISKDAEHVLLLKFIYFINFPLLWFFLKFKIKANTVTTLSNLSAVFSFYFLFNNETAFYALWTFALFLDVCDGMIARATSTSSANGSFYDHYSDIAKILFLYLSIAIKYNDQIIWILAMLNAILFSLMAIANTILSKKVIEEEFLAKNKLILEKINKTTKNKLKLVLFIKKFPLLKKIILESYSSIFVIYGNFNLLLLPLAYSKDIAQYTFILILFVVTKSLISIVRHVMIKNINLYKKAK